MTYSRTYTKGAVKVTEKGDIFDRARVQGVLNRGIRAGTHKLLPEVEKAVLGKLDASLRNPTGKYRATITSQEYESGVGVVKSTDNRKLKTWLETGRRSGVKTRRKGAYAWRAGKTLAKNAKKDGFYKAEIAKVLDG